MGKLRHTLVATLLAAALAGCGSGTASPSVEHTRSASVASSPTPSSFAIAPRQPRAAKYRTIAGAKAFVDFYMDLITYAESTLDTAPIEAASLPACRGCWGGINELKKFQRQGDRITGAHLNADAMSTSTIDKNGVISIFFEAVNSKETVSRPGRKTLIHPAGRNPMVMTIAWQDAGWKATQYEARQ